VVKMKLKKTGDHIPKLITAIKMLCVMDMDMAYFKKLASSLPKRLKLINKRKGEWTKY
jgi:hypothetical protein